MKVKKIYGIAAGALFLLMGLAVYGPGLIDWKDHELAFRTAVFDASGCHLSIDGDMSMELFPTPKITLADVRLTESSEVGASSTMTILGVDAALSFRELLKGHIKIERMTLLQPRLLAPIGHKKLCDASALGMTIKGGVNFDQSNPTIENKIRFSIKQLEIKNGVFPLKLPGQKKDIDVTKVNFQIDMLRDGTRALFKGGGLANDVAFDANFSLSNIHKGRAPSLNGELVFPTIASTLTLVGNMTQPMVDGNLLKGAFNGNVTFDAKGSKLFLQELAPGYVAGMADVPLHFESEIQVTSRYIGLNNYRFENGPLRGTGAVSVNLKERPVLDILYSSKTLDLDEILNLTSSKKTPDAALIAIPSVDVLMDEASGQSLYFSKSTSKSQRLNLVNIDLLFEKLVRDIEMEISLDITIGALKYAGGVVREAGLHTTFGDGSLTVDRATAIFPGGSDMSLFGFIGKTAKAPRFEGKISIKSDDFKRFLEWADVTDSLFRTNRLRSLAYQSDVQITPTSVQFSSIDLTLDASRMTGQIGLYFKDQYPKLHVELAADQINLDAYFGLLGQNTKTAASSSDIAVAQNDNSTIQVVSDFSPRKSTVPLFDAEINIAAQQLSLFKERAKDIKLNLELIAGNLILKQLKFSNFASIEGEIVGEVDDVFGKPVFRLKAKALSNNLSSALSGLGLGPDLVRFAYGKGAIDGVFSYAGPLNNGLLDAVVTSDFNKLVARGVLSLTSDGLAFSLENGAYHDPDWRLDNVRGILSNSAGALLSFREIEATYQGGKISIPELALTGSILDGFGITADGHLNGLALGSTLTDLADLISIDGIMNVDFQMRAQAPQIADLISKLSIDGEISGEATLIASKKAQPGSIQIQPIVNVQNFLARHFGNKAYPLAGQYHWEDSKLQTENIHLESSTASVDVLGVIDFARKNTAANLVIKEKASVKDYVTINITGPWDGPSVKSSVGWINGGD